MVDAFKRRALAIEVDLIIPTKSAENARYGRGTQLISAEDTN